MPSLSDHPSNRYLKAMLVGDSGTGKTGSLASLAKAGFKLRIIDTDQGVDILAKLLSGVNCDVQFMSITDKAIKLNGEPALDGTGFHKVVNALYKWEDGSDPQKWDHSYVLVLDSWSRICEMSMTNTLRIDSKVGKKPEIQHWGSAIEDLRVLLNQLNSGAYQCNVLFLNHITFIADESSRGGVGGNMNGKDFIPTRALPNGLGNKLPTETGKYFNNMLGYKISGQRRTIETVPFQGIGFKAAAFEKVKKSYDISTGLAEFFAESGVKPS